MFYKEVMEAALTSEMIRQRRIAAERGIADAEAAIVTFRQQLADLAAAERVMKLVSGDAPAQFALHMLDIAEPPRFFGGGPAVYQVDNPYRPNTNKAFLWQALSNAENPWMTANEARDIASKLKGADIPMSSVSPMLTEMKDDGNIERDGMRVALASRVQPTEMEVSDT